MSLFTRDFQAGEPHGLRYNLEKSCYGSPCTATRVVDSRREFVFAIGTLLAAAPLSAQNQQRPKVSRVGYLFGSSPSVSARYEASFRDRLRALGYVEGKNLVIEYRWAAGNFDLLPALAAELVELHVDVIVADGDPVIFAAKQATNTIPIVMTAVGDPVGRGFVTSLARPGGNVTGVSNLAVALTLKWLEMVKEIAPGLPKVAILGNDANPTHKLFRAEAHRGAPSLNVRLQNVDVHASDDLDKAFASIVSEGAGAVVVLPDPLLALVLRRPIAELAVRQRLPALGTFKEQVEAGSLVSYGPSLVDNHRQAAAY